MASTDWAAEGCSSPRTDTRWNGQPLSAVIGELGQPARDERFALGEGINEFRIELQNLFPLPANADLAVLESHWEAGNCRLTLWSVGDGDTQTVRLGSMWPADAEF